MPAVGRLRRLPVSGGDRQSLRRTAVRRKLSVLREGGGEAGAVAQLAASSALGNAGLRGCRRIARGLWRRHRPDQRHGAGRYGLPAVSARAMRPPPGGAADRAGRFQRKSYEPRAAVCIG